MPGAWRGPDWATPARTQRGTSVNQGPVILAACEPDEDATLDSMLAQVQASWPEQQSPRFIRARLDEVHVRLRTMSDDEIECVLALLPTHIAPSVVDQVHDALHERCVPGVLATDNVAAWRSVQRDGVLFESRSTSMSTIAAMLYALSERQGAVRVLSREIMLAQRCQAGFRVEMERLHDELHLAASIQREFAYAPLPKLDGLDLGVVFKPMSFVSGDVYAVERIGPHHVGVLLADVVGHGVPAALLTMVLRNSLVMARDGVPIAPAEVLSRLNDRMCESQQGSGRFATALYAVFDTRTRVLTLAGAGHPSPILISGSQRRALETDGPLLGVFEESVFTQVEATLNPGDTLLMYTDGLDMALEALAKQAGLKSSIDAVSALVERVADVDSASSLAREVAALIDEQCGSLHQADDVTVLAVRVPMDAARGAAPIGATRAA